MFSTPQTIEYLIATLGNDPRTPLADPLVGAHAVRHEAMADFLGQAVGA